MNKHATRTHWEPTPRWPNDGGTTLDEPAGTEKRASQQRYRIVDILGSGGMGRVFLAHDNLLGRNVALKILTGEPPEVLQREGQAVAQIQGEHVPTVHDLRSIRGELTLVYEHLVGCGLDTLQPPVAWPKLLDYAVGLAQALASVHAAGFLHLDIKPANAILTEGGEVKLIDFGLARRLTAPAEHCSPGKPKVIAGTPPYIAPELRDGHEPLVESDIYSMGVLLYWLSTGVRPSVTSSSARHALALPHSDELAPEFVTIINRCLDPEPGRRFGSAQDLCDSLCALRDAESPYRGLLPFDSRAPHLFFGRDSDIERVLAAMECHIPVLLVGDSGVGKTSLIQAGVRPRLHSATWSGRRGFTTHWWTPGAHPLHSLAAVLARICELEPTDIRNYLQRGQVEIVCEHLQNTHRDNLGTVLLADQLEELLTVADPEQARLVGRFLFHLISTPVDGWRLLASLRSDYMSRMSATAGVGSLIRAAHTLVLWPLSGRDVMTEIIAKPAHMRGFKFESPSLVEELAETASEQTRNANEQASLPLLQFVLEEMWRRRDQHERILTRQSLRALGGLPGALGRHADAFFKGLDPAAATVARRLLTSLVTPDMTRRRRRLTELIANHDDESVRRVLDGLVKQRLLVGYSHDGEAEYGIAHEALVTHWPRLREWLHEEDEKRATRDALVEAARQWNWQERPRDQLWGRLSLARAEALDEATLPTPAPEFLRASHRAVSRNRCLIQASVVLVLWALVAGYLFARESENRAQKRHLVEHLRQAKAVFAQGAEAHRHYDQRRETLERDLRARPDMDFQSRWDEVYRMPEQILQTYDAALFLLEQVQPLAPRDLRVREQLRAVLEARIHLRNQLGRHQSAARDLYKLKRSWPMRHQTWTAKRRVRLHLHPAGATVRIQGYGRKTDDDLVTIDRYTFTGATTMVEFGLEPGSWLISASWPRSGREPRFEMRHPLLIHPRERLEDIHLRQPDDTSLTDRGFAFVPAGKFLYGAGRDSHSKDWPTLLDTTPLHERHTEAFWIARHEATFRQWLSYRAQVEPARCPPPRTATFNAVQMTLACVRDQVWSIEWKIGDSLHRAENERANLLYQRRTRHKSVSWLDTPAVALTPDEIHEYLSWLDRSGAVPGARLCREDEWERAARGADGRHYPHGDRLRPNQANHDLTYGAADTSFGLDVVGSWPQSNSPFGLSDMVGNAWELVTPIEQPRGRRPASDDAARPTYYERGGSFYQNQLGARSANRSPVGQNPKTPLLGFRVCANPR